MKTKKTSTNHLIRSRPGQTLVVCSTNLTFMQTREEKSRCSKNVVRSPIYIEQPDRSSRQRDMMIALLLRDAFFWQAQGSWWELVGRVPELNIGNSWRKTCWSLQKTWDWGGGSPSGKTMTLNILHLLVYLTETMHTNIEQNKSVTYGLHKEHSYS